MKEGNALKGKDINFEYIEDFADYIIEKVENDEELFLTVVGKFEEVKNIIKEMMCVAEVDFENIKLESPDVDGYKDEYIFDCWCSNGVVEIGCEPAKRDNEYINLCGDETYLLENVSSKIIPLCDRSDLYFVNIDDECDCDCDEDCDCDSCKCYDSDMPLALNVKFNLDTDEAEKIIRKYRDDFYKEVGIFKELLDF